MRRSPDAPRGTDPVLLAEAGLALILLALTVYLFLIPSASPSSEPAWWTWLLLGTLFFGLIGLDTWRRRRDRRRT